ncbi:MAG: metal ABC transporter solute-binding protein, Zn/Mn family [Alcanivoracaceae bacterium]
MRRLLVLFCFFVTAQAQAITVLASMDPLAMLLRDALGDRVTVDTFLLPSQTPHDASFTPGQARKVQQADLIVWLGADAEPALAKLMARQRSTNLAMLSLEGIHQRKMQDTHDHHHGHHHGALDPHLWLSPDNMRVLARGLSRHATLFGMNEAEMDQALAAFEQRLDDTRQRLQQQLAPLANRPYMSHHDAWGYFAEAFGLRQVTPIAASTDLSPGSRRFVALVKRIESDSIRCFMAEPESRRALLERLCRDHCRIVEADPLGRQLGSVSYTVLLQDLADRFTTCLRQPEG